MQARDKIKSMIPVFRRDRSPKGCAHPSDILSRIRATALEEKKILLNRTFAPDKYEVFLSPEDTQSLAPLLDSLTTELAEETNRFMQRRGLNINTESVDVRFKVRHTQRMGDVTVSAAYTNPDQDKETEPPQAGPQMEVLLVLHHPDTENKEVRLLPGVHVVGRGRKVDVPLAPEDLTVSKKHCQIIVTPDSVTVEDLGSINGVFVNKTRVDGLQALGDRDLLEIGATRIEVSF